MGDIRIVRCFVWGWDDQAMTAQEKHINAIFRYTNSALAYGLSEDEIADDLYENYGHLFEDVDIEIDGHEIHVVCLPHGLPPSIPAASANCVATFPAP